MTQEEKQLLIRDLCVRLPYEIKVEVCIKDKNIKSVDCVKYDTVGTYIRLMDDEKFLIKPYLRPMSSMTEDELWEYNELYKERENNNEWDDLAQYHELIFWIISKHLDYLHLIEKGLALEAPEDMYENK